MSLPRRLVPGATYLVTRRCTRRCFLLKPTPQVNAIVRYPFVVAASRHGIRVHAVYFGGNHWHAVLTDPQGRLPDFMRDCNSLIARGLNSYRGRGEGMWASGPFSSVELPDREAVLESMAYVLTQAVKDGLVSRQAKWPGFRTLVRDVGARVLVARRPKGAFFGSRRADPSKARIQPRRRRTSSKLPDHVRAAVEVPPGFNASPAEFRALLDERVHEHLTRIRAERRVAGKTRFLGLAGIRALDPFASAGATWPSFQRNPRIAPGRDRETRVARLRDLKAWRAEYRRCRLLWEAGQREIRFPVGTYLLRVRHKALVAQPNAPPRAA